MGEVLCFLTMLLAIVTVVGHGLWLLAAAILRFLFAQPQDAQVGPRHCFACGHPDAFVEGRCRFCGASASASSQSELYNDLLATSRQLERWFQSGDIDDQKRDELVQLAHKGLASFARKAAIPPTPSPTTAQEKPFIDQPAALSARPAADVDIASMSPPAATSQESVDRHLGRAQVEDSAEFITAEIVETSLDTIGTPDVRRELLTAATAPATVDRARPTHDAPAVSSPPSRPLADLLQAFMEEKNIRWGELISGLLIIGSAIGLVISLRHEIVTLSRSVPYFPAFLFMLVTATIHAAGNYTLRRWNLQATSRGVLIIATLLVPLNFVAAVMLSDSGERQLPVTHPLYWLAVAVGILSFGTMVYFASRALMRDSWWQMIVAVLGISVGQLPLSRLASPEMAWSATTGLFLVPFGCFLVPTVAQGWQASQRKTLSRRRAEQLLLLLGMATFSLIVPLGLLIAKAANLRDTLADLSPMLSLVAESILVTGLIVHQRATLARLANIRTTGTALALLGGLLMLAMVLLAWPQPELLIAVGLVNCVALIAIAIIHRLPHLHGPAIGCFTLAYLVGFFLLQGHFVYLDLPRELLQVLLMGRSSIALTVLAVAVAGAQFGWRHFGRAADGLIYFWGGVVIAGLSVAIALSVGFGDFPPTEVAQTTPVMLANAVVLIVAGAMLRNTYVTWGSGALLLASLVHALAWNEPIIAGLAAVGISLSRPILVATLSHGLIAAGLCFAAWEWPLKAISRDRTVPLWKGFVAPLSQAALVTSVAAAPSAVLVRDQLFLSHGVYLLCIAAVWLVVAVIHGWAVIFSAFQAVTAVALTFLVCAIGQRGQWWDGDWLDLRLLSLQMSTLALWCLAWSGFRKLMADHTRTKPLFKISWPPVDQVVLAALVAGIISLSMVGCIPGIQAELGLSESAAASDYPHELAYGWNVWLALGIIVSALLVSLWERLSLDAMVGMLVAGAAVPLLISARFESTDSVASAMRWTFALYGLGATALVCCRRQLDTLVRRAAWLGWDRYPANAAGTTRGLALFLSGLPVFLLTLIAAAQAAHVALTGPAQNSLFDRLGPTISYAGPLLMYVGALVCCAIRERSPEFMLGGSVVLQFTITLACVLRVLLSGASFDTEAAIGLLQWNALGLSAFSLGWLALRLRIEGQQGPTSIGTLDSVSFLTMQLLMMTAAVFFLAAWATAAVLFDPSRVAGFAPRLGAPLSWLAAVLAAAAWGWYLRRRLESLGFHLAGALAVVFSAFLAASAAAWDGPQGWFAFHSLQLSWLATAAVGTVLACLRTYLKPPAQNIGEPADNRWHQRWVTLLRPSFSWATAVGGLVVVASLRGSLGDPIVWWPVGPLLATTGLAIFLGLLARSQPHAYASAIIAMLAATIFWIDLWRGMPPANDSQMFYELVQFNLVTAVVVSLVWLAAEIWWQRVRWQTFSAIALGPPVHHLAAMGATGILLLISVVGVLITTVAASERADFEDFSNVWIVFVLFCLAVLLVASLWDQRANFVLPCLYFWGISLLAAMIDQIVDVRPIGSSGAVTAVALAGAGYVALTGHVWKWGLNLARLGSRLAVPQTVTGLERVSRWLPTTNLTLAGLVVLIVTIAIFGFETRWMRMSAGFCLVLLSYGLAMLAQEKRRETMQELSLGLFGLAVIYLGWADIAPIWQSPVILEFVVRSLIALSLLTFAFGYVTARTPSRLTGWTGAIRRMATNCGIASLAVLGLVLVLEFAFFEAGSGFPFSHPYQPLVVALVLVGLVAALIMLALSPEPEPLGLTEEGRMLYVYAAEAVAGLLFAHLYLARPMWFAGILREYWPYTVLTIAFAAVGAGELCRRYGIRVLHEPLHRTSAFLPLLPVLAYWVIHRESAVAVEASGIPYFVLMLMVGALYATLGALRQSLACGLAAAVAGNIALLAFYYDRDFTFLRHPQFWLIPPALSVLVAAHINRHRLDAKSLMGIRYAAVLLIYLSSTAEMIIDSAEPSLWPPMVLAVVAVGGALAGIVFRIRAFLYLGTSFVFLAVLSMVWQAQRLVAHSWPWWVFGVVLGLLILSLFGVFEMKRREVTLLIERLRNWEH